ncbi:MAG: STAS domain-containing protein [Spirochaetes bacterium]|nr:STAS domain-containing protein [Spirochaetota bacterium]
MEIQRKKLKNSIVLNLFGDIDSYNSSVLKDIITSNIEQSGMNITINLSAVDSIDMEAIKVLKACFKRSGQYQSSLNVINPTGLNIHNSMVLH